MIKKTLVAMTAVVLLAAVAQAAIEVHPFGPISKSTGVKVDGKETVRWPFEYKALVICSMPVRMSIGMFVQVENCSDRKIVLEQVDCAALTSTSKGSGDFPCYSDCEKFKVRANFEVKLGTNLIKEPAAEGKAQVIDGWNAFYKSTDIIPGDGDYHEVEVCVEAWKARIWEGAVGDEVKVGTLEITAKPNV